MCTLCPLFAKETELNEPDVNVNSMKAAACAEGIMKGDKIYSLLHLVLPTMHPIQR